MKFNLKFLLILFILSALLIKNTLAQFPGMSAVRAQQSQQFAAQQMNMQMQAQSSLARMLNIRGLQATNKEYDFIVTLSDSTSTKVVSAIYTDSATRKRFIIFVDNQFKTTDSNRYKKIYPNQTSNLTCVLLPRNPERNEPGSYMMGKPTDTCWAFTAIKGHLTVYSYIVPDGVEPFLPSMISGIQLNDGPVLQFNLENLKTMVGQNARALELIEDKKYIRAIERFNRDSNRETKK